MVFSQAMSMHTWTEFNFVDYNFWDAAGDIYKEFSLAGDANDKLKLASDPDYQKRFADSYDPAVLAGVAGGALDSFQLVNAHNKGPYDQYEGKLLGEIAAAQGLGIVDLFFDLFKLYCWFAHCSYSVVC